MIFVAKREGMMSDTKRWLLLAATGALLGLTFQPAPAVQPAVQPAVPTVQVAQPQRLPGEYWGFEPIVAADGAGRVMVAAIDEPGKGRILVWTSADGGKTFSTPRPPPMEPRAPQFDPWLATSGPGRFHLCLLAKRPKARGTYAYVLSTSDGGATWTPATEMTSGAFDADRPVFAVSPNGKHAALAFYAGGPGGPLHVRFSSDGMKTWTPAPQAPDQRGGWPSGIVIDDAACVVVGYRVTDSNIVRLQLAQTADGGKTWARRDLGISGDRQGLGPNGAAGVSMLFSGAPLAAGKDGVVHVLAAHQGADADRIDLWHRRSQANATWSEPRKLAQAAAPMVCYPALAASGLRLHAIWLQIEKGWCNVVYRGSIDGGLNWSDATALSTADSASGLQTAKGFRSFSGHYMGVAEDGRGAAHVVWAVRDPENAGRPGEVWHTIVRLRP